LESKKVRKVAVLFLALLWMVAFWTNGNAVPPPDDTFFSVFRVTGEADGRPLVYPASLKVKEEDGRPVFIIPVGPNSVARLVVAFCKQKSAGACTAKVINNTEAFAYTPTAGWFVQADSFVCALDKAIRVPAPGRATVISVSTMAPLFWQREADLAFRVVVCVGSNPTSPQCILHFVRDGGDEPGPQPDQAVNFLL
jgi:hypothetical protein